MAISRAGVVGLGAMGAGIAEVLAKGGVDVVAVEANEQFLTRGQGIIEKSLQRAVEKGKLSSAESEAITARITATTNVDDVADVDLVIEAIPEKLEWKAEMFGKLDDIVSPQAILATNTSSLSVTKIAESTRYPERVIGIHFFNPAPVMQFVEIIKTTHTNELLAQEAFAFAKSLGKLPILITDRAGFVANYLLLGYLNNAAKLLESGVYTRDDIDASMREGKGLPMGPMTLMDLVGNDVMLPVLETIYAETRDADHQPSALIEQLVRENKLGRKTGRGFFTYENGQVIDAADGTVRQEIIDALWTPFLNEAIGMLNDGYASAEDIDLAMTKGCGYPHGPIAAAREAGML